MKNKLAVGIISLVTLAAIPAYAADMPLKARRRRC